jgi:ABC-type Fe3+/spermidine/putrescine transport system ATPase subunit
LEYLLGECVLQTTSSESALRVVDLVKQYSPAVRVGPISFDVRQGEFLSLLGPSGCGKSTTLRCLAGFEDVSSGEIWLGEKRLDRVPAYRRGLGLVFQHYALFPHLSVFDNVAFGLRLAKVSRSEIERRVAASLEMVDLSSAARRLPSEISGGQQQRVAIARAVVMEPSVILFDEPLSNLDLKLRVQMRKELRNLQKQLGKTMVYVTHDQTEALALSDRIVVMSHGRIEQFGTPKEIYEAPATPFVADFMGSSNLIKGQVLGPQGELIRIGVDGGPQLLVDPGGRRIVGQVLAMLRPEHVVVGPAGSAVPDVENSYPSQIVDVVYLGDSLSLTLRLDGGTSLLATVRPTARQEAPRPGKAVTIGFSAADVHVLPS